MPAGATSWAVAIAGAALVVQGCSSGGGGGDQGDGGDRDVSIAADDTGTDDAPAAVDAPSDVVLTYAPTYTAIWDEILFPSCALVFCHGAGGNFFDLGNKDVGYSSLVNVPASGPGCLDSGLKRVVPGHPESSLLYLKVTTPPCGDKMPYNGYTGVLDARQTGQIAGWIEAGAPND